MTLKIAWLMSFETVMILLMTALMLMRIVWTFPKRIWVKSLETLVLL